MIVTRRWIFALLLVAIIGTIGIGIRYLPDLHWIAEREDLFRRRIAEAPFATWVVSLALYIGISMLPGTAGKSIVVGWLFGFIAALLMVEIGLTTAAVLSFLLGRFWIQQILVRRWQIRLRLLSRKFSRDGAFFLLWLRLAHAPFTIVNYGAGATKIPLFTFWWTTHLGILPATMVFTFLGSRIPSIHVVADQGVWAILNPSLILALAATALLPLFLKKWVRKSRR